MAPLVAPCVTQMDGNKCFPSVCSLAAQKRLSPDQAGFLRQATRRVVHDALLVRYPDVDAVPRCRFEQVLDVGVSWRRCRGCVVGERLSNLEEHFFQSGGRDGDQQPSRPVAFVPEAVQASDGHVQECPFARDDAVLTELKRHLAFKDEERLLLSTVNVRRWTAAGRNDGFEHGVPAVRFVAGGEETVHVANNADATAFARLSDGRRVIHGHLVDFLCWSLRVIYVVAARHFNNVSNMTAGAEVLSGIPRSRLFRDAVGEQQGTEDPIREAG